MSSACHTPTARWRSWARPRPERRRRAARRATPAGLRALQGCDLVGYRTAARLGRPGRLDRGPRAAEHLRDLRRRRPRQRRQLAWRGGWPEGRVGRRAQRRRRACIRTPGRARGAAGRGHARRPRRRREHGRVHRRAARRRITTAHRWTPCCYEEWVRRNPINDYTIPRSSLIKGHKAEAMLERVFGEVRLEELARSFYCASVNLRGNSLVIDRDGPMARPSEPASRCR